MEENNMALTTFSGQNLQENEAGKTQKFQESTRNVDPFLIPLLMNPGHRCAFTTVQSQYPAQNIHNYDSLTVVLL